MIRYAVPVAIVALCTAALSAQKTTNVHAGKGGSPHVRTEWTIDGANISIEYGRPYLKGRTIGKDVVPYGTIWRAGADEATTLKADKALKFGNLSVPPGTYTLFTLPGEKEWQLVISKQTGQWGTDYAEGQDLGRVPMRVGQAKTAAEQVTFSIDDTPQGAALRLGWGTTSVSTPFTVAGQS
jgi:DUF2911 family protein